MATGSDSGIVQRPDESEKASSNSDAALRASGTWLAMGAGLLALALIFHGPPSPSIAEQMQIIAEGTARWSIVHWTAATSLSCFAVSGLIVLTSGSRLTGDWTTISAWAVLVVGALWTMTTAVAEATAVAHAAASNNRELFEAWWKFAEGKGNGFVFLALAVAVIASTEASSADGATPTWAAWVGTAAAVISPLGWALGLWIGIGIGGPIWVASSLVMCVWLLWLGVALAREKAG